MIDFKRLAEAVGELEEEEMVEILEQVMEEGGDQAAEGEDLAQRPADLAGVREVDHHREQHDRGDAADEAAQ